MSDLSLQTPLRVSKDVVFRDLDGEVVILNLASGKYFGLDPVGTRIWQLIEEHRRLDHVLRHLLGEYDAPADTLERDLMTLASELLQRGLIAFDDGTPSAT